MIYTDPVAAAPAFVSALERVRRILILSHINPDGDAIGSMLGLGHTLRHSGKEVFMVASSAPPDYTMFLPGISDVQVYEPQQGLPEVDLIWLVDTASIERLGPIYHEHAPTLTACPLVIVDHHVTNNGAGLVNLVVPAAASCAELLFSLLTAMMLPIVPMAATCLLLGLTTDTQSFQTSSTNPQSFRVAAELLEAGADQRAIIESVYYATPYSTLQLVGLALCQMQREGDLLWTYISQDMLQQTGAEDEAGDDVVRLMQRTAGTRACVLFKERANGEVKISLRSLPGINVARIAQTWGGGGHEQAAGATLAMDLGTAQREVIPLVQATLNQQRQV